MNLDELTDQEVACLRRLRERGFAVSVWTPYELELLDEDMTVEDLEDAVCEYASNFLTGSHDEKKEN